MQKKEIEKIVDSAFDEAFSKIQPRLDSELYPAAFANEYSWLRVRGALNANNRAIRQAVKEALTSLLGDPS